MDFRYNAVNAQPRWWVHAGLIWRLLMRIFRLKEKKTNKEKLIKTKPCELFHFPDAEKKQSSFSKIRLRLHKSQAARCLSSEKGGKAWQGTS